MPGFAAIRQDEYPATADVQCVAVYIPEGDEYKALLAGFLAILCDVDSYEDPTSAQAEGVAATFDEGYSQTNFDGCGIPPECLHMDSDLLLFGINADVKNGNAMTWVVNTSQRMAGVFQQSAAANGDKYAWERSMSPGNWEYRLTYFRNTGNGIINLKVADEAANVENVSYDLFGSALANQYHLGSFTMTEGGACEISIEVTGKNASSSGFAAQITCLELWRIP